jgi:hypothetical protein
MAQTIFAATIFNPLLKSDDHPKRIYTDQELYMVLCAMFVALFFDIDTSKPFPMRHAAEAAMCQLGAIVATQVKAMKSWGWQQGTFDPLNVHGRNNSAFHDYGHLMIKRLLEYGNSLYDVTWK